MFWKKEKPPKRVKRIRKVKKLVDKAILEVRFAGGRIVHYKITGAVAQVTRFNSFYHESEYCPNLFQTVFVKDTWKIQASYLKNATRSGNGFIDSEGKMQYGEIITIFPKQFEPHEIEIDEVYYES